ncbi:thioredoxin domain-containing protein [Streptomyces sp. G-G2]|uniref:DsbA family protein n=1 Tax=Streptomyces sp. G-G2 TaxID=3046201 RepID=UPI0024BAF293|nr:thioredoxin domain-containing protein [Streptomyces sp. G-G2]MDJ0384364.1 thioredoxin domain-containing protein [Streptomyces sp. G-G2]
MSDKNDGANRDAKRTARERLLVERERQKSKDKRRRTLVVSAAVVGVLGLAAVVGLLAANSGKSGADQAKSGPVVAPSGAAGKDALAIQTGKDTAKSTLTVWEDFRCPACKSFEDSYRPTINELVAKGQLKVEYHLVTLIDGNMTGSGSAKGANAAACAQDAGKFPGYHDVLFENQPKEVDDAYGKNARLIELAAKVDGLDTPAFRQCVEGGTHNSWVAKSYDAFKAAKFRGTPTILLDGKDIFADQANPLTPEKLKAKVTTAAGAGPSGTGASAKPSASTGSSGAEEGEDAPSAAASAKPSRH